MVVAKWLFSCILAALAAVGFSGHALAQDYPTRTVQIHAPFSPGGALDIAARSIAKALQDSLGQPFVVVNQAGASGNIGAANVARSAPDGYTLLMTPDTSIAANTSLYGKRMGFDPQRDLEMVAAPMTFGQMLVVHPSLPVRTLAEFVEYASKNSVTYGSAGIASPGHLTMERFALQTGIEVRHIPYKGQAQALNDMLSGEVQSGFMAVPGVIQHVKAGKLIALAVSGEARSPLMPEIPTLAESGFQGGTIEFFYVLMAPRGTPSSIVDRLNKEVQSALRTEGVQSFMKRVDFRALPDSAEAAAKRLSGRTEEMVRLLDARNIRLD